MLAWATTNHKVWGLTVEQIVDMYEDQIPLLMFVAMAMAWPNRIGLGHCCIQRRDDLSRNQIPIWALCCLSILCQWPQLQQCKPPSSSYAGWDNAIILPHVCMQLTYIRTGAHAYYLHTLNVAMTILVAMTTAFYLFGFFWSWKLLTSIYIICVWEIMQCCIRFVCVSCTCLYVCVCVVSMWCKCYSALLVHNIVGYVHVGMLR